MINTFCIRFILLPFLLLSTSGLTNAQGIKSDTLHATERKSMIKKSIVAPALLISTGLLATTDNEIIDKLEIREERNEWIGRFQTHADDYLQYAPIVAVYGLNAVGIKGSHDFVNRTALLFKSELFMLAMVLPLKKFAAVPRPDTGAPTSFPSGHTAQAFAAATFLHKEYGKDHPLYSVLAYSTAAGVGVLRVMNDRHWASDVLVGAGIGILATNLAYLTHKNKWGTKHHQFSGMMLTPTYGQRSVGMFAVIPIH